VSSPSPEVLEEVIDPLINSDEAIDCTHAEENSARLALRLSTAFWTCHSQTSETRLSTQLPQAFPSFLIAGQVPRSFAYPMAEMDASDSGVTARMFVVGWGVLPERCHRVFGVSGIEYSVLDSTDLEGFQNFRGEERDHRSLPKLRHVFEGAFTSPFVDLLGQTTTIGV